MSKTVDTTYDAPGWDEAFAGQLVKESTWQDQAARQHHLFSMVGARTPLMYRPDSGWETTSSTYTTTDESTLAEDLDMVTACVRLRRSIVVGGGSHRGLTVHAFGKDVDLRVTVYAVNTAFTLGTIDISCGSSGAGGEWASGSLTLTEGSWSSGGAPIEVGLTLQAKTSASTGYLLQAFCHEVVATAAQLPDQ